MSAKRARKGKFGNPIPIGSIEKGEGRTDKWADYVIFRVRYVGRHPHIEEVELREDCGAWFGPPEKWPRKKVISAWEKCRFMTVDSGAWKKGELEKGEDVLLIKIGNEKYLRTHRTMDDLEDLDRF